MGEQDRKETEDINGCPGVIKCQNGLGSNKKLRIRAGTSELGHPTPPPVVGARVG